MKLLRKSISIFTLSKRYVSDLVESKISSKIIKSGDKWTLAKSLPENINPAFTNIILFPGQGCQVVGMGKSLIEHKECLLLYEVASDILKYDLLKLCLQGPKSQLSKTIFCQPAIYVTCLAAMEKIRLENPEIIENCIATAGLSLGEITSLVFSGSLSFEAGLRYIRVRSENMQRACNETSSGLMNVFLNPKSELGKAMEFAKMYCRDKLNILDPVCQTSTYLFSECKVIGGNMEALDFIETYSKDFHLRVKRLDVSGAFHTVIMKSAVVPCQNILHKIGGIREAPRIITMSNVTGRPHHHPATIEKLLPLQIVKPVLWEQIMHGLFERPQTPEAQQHRDPREYPLDDRELRLFPNIYEVGPNDQLGSTIKKINLSASKFYKNISV